MSNKVVKTKDIAVGDIFDTNEGGSVTVIKLLKGGKVLIKHNDEFGYEVEVEKIRLLRGTIKNPYHRSVQGVGYHGVGEYKTQVNKVLDLAYKKWRGMMTRNYYDDYESRLTSYKDCYVADEWHNLQTFSDWYYGQVGWDKGFELDKDLLSEGGKVYSPETCCLIPREINTAIVSLTNSDSIMGYHERRNGLFEVHVKVIKGSYKSFRDKDDAINYYLSLKKKIVEDLILKWDGKVDNKVIEKLKTWKF